MKQDLKLHSSRRKSRKAHFTAPAHIRQKLMAAGLSKELRSEHSVRSMPVRKNDQVKIVRGKYKDLEGAVTQVYRKKWVIYVENAQRTLKEGKTGSLGIDPSKVVITQLYMDDSRRKQLDAKKRGKQASMQE